MNKYLIICLKIAAIIACIACAVIYTLKAGETYGYAVAVGKDFHFIATVFFYSYIMFLIFMVADKGGKKELVLYKTFIVLATLALLYRYLDKELNLPSNW